MITKKSFENCLSVRQMSFRNLFLLFFIFIVAQQVNAQRAMYVSLTPTTQENWVKLIPTLADQDFLTPQAEAFLQYAKDNNVSYIILYGLNNLIDNNFKYNLDVFIGKAKNDFCIASVGANIEGGNVIGFPNGTNLLALYNNNPNYPNKINALVCEQEFWNNPGTFETTFLPMLDLMNNMKENSGSAEQVIGLNQVDVYLQGKDPYTGANHVASTQIFSNTQLTGDINFDLNLTEQNVNKVDNRADNIFITCYKGYDGDDANYVGYYDANKKFKTLFNLFANTNVGDGNSSSKTQSKNGTNVFPLFGVFGTENNDSWTRGYYYDDPTIDGNSTPQELEMDLFNFYSENNNANDPANRISKSNVAWYKYQFMPGTIYTSLEYPLYTINNEPLSNILFSSNPTQVCNQVTFDYSGPNEDGINYTWNFGDGTPVVTGTTSSTNQLATSDSRIHVFPASGSYTVTLFLTYPSGCSYSYSILYNLQVIGNVPNLLVTTTNTSGCSNEDGSVSVLNQNGNISSAIWTNSTGQVNATNTSTTSTAINLPMDVYNVTVTNNQGCVAFGSTTIYNGLDTYRPNGYEVIVDETWSSTTALPILLLKGVVYVNSGATLTIDNATVQFAYDVIDDNDEGDEILGARFQVNGGGTLIIKNNSVLSGCDDGIWDGIELRSVDNSALIQVNTNSTIKNAKIGITNDRRVNKYRNLIAGGVIQADNANFINNRLGVELKYGTIDSYFKDSRFNYDNNTLFNFPANNTEIGEWTAQEMTFVHLKLGNRIKFEGNNFETNAIDFPIAERGTGIFSESARYELGSITTNGNNTFKNLTKGIEKIESPNTLGRISATGNTFTNIPYGITDKGGISDRIQNNTFTNIPSSDIINNATYGIFMIGSSDFSLTGNNFIGSASINAQSFGSHGIVVENAGSIASTCFDNHFKGTDYGVHTQGNNINFKIRCNVFSEDGIDHNIAGIYVYDGVLKNQGLIDCDQYSYKAAGNTWLGPKNEAGESISSFADQPFTYYANPATYGGSYIPNPSPIFGTINLQATCGMSSNTGTDCSSITAGLGVYGSASWYAGIYELIASNRDKIKYYKLGHDYLLTNKEDSVVVSLDDYDSLVNLAKETIEWYINENQFFENELLHAYLQDENDKEINNLFSKSSSSELCKLLSFYFLNTKEYEKCHQTIDQLTFVFENEEPYMEKTKSELMRKENDAFIEYINIVLDLAENELTIFDISPKQYDVLKSIIEQKAQISVMAESDLFAIKNTLFEHPIYKHGGEKSKKLSSSIKTNSENNFNVFPNPTNGSVSVNCFIPENSNINRFIIYDAVGKIKKSIPIADKGNLQLQFECNDIANGVYNCHIISDNQTVNTSKLIILK